MSLRKVEQTSEHKAFLHFVPNFWAYLMIFQSGESAKGKNLAKNEEKPCSTCLLKIHFSRMLPILPKTQNLATRTRSITSKLYNNSEKASFKIFYQYQL